MADKLCERCDEGWLCEEHPDQPYGHEGCEGTAMQCDAPGCKWPKRTGLVGPECKGIFGVIETQTPTLITFWYQACDHRWFTGENAGIMH